MHARHARATARYRRPFGRGSAILAAVLSMVLIAPTAPAAFAAPMPQDALLTLSKVVNLGPGQSAAALQPGDKFSYTVTTSCSAQDSGGCYSAAINDSIPAPLKIDTSNAAAPRGVTVDGGGNSSGVVVNGSDVTVNFTQALTDPAGVGLVDGSTNVSVTIYVVVPSDLSLNDSGLALNVASVSAENAATALARVPVTIVVPKKLSATSTKTVSPSSAVPAVAGQEIDFTVTGSSTSNGKVDSLTIQDPADGAADPFQCAAPGPSQCLALTGFSGFIPPPGADRVQAWFKDAEGNWNAAAGPVAIPTDAGDLFPGVTLGDVHGVRFTFTSTSGPTIAAGGTPASVTLNTQTTDAVVGIPDATTVSLVNKTQTIVTQGGDASTPATSTATAQIQREKPKVALSKLFLPDEAVAGGTSTMTLRPQNGITPVSSMVISEPGAGAADLAAQGLEFQGFVNSAIEWPVGATGASITYTYADGAGDPQETTTQDTLPAADASRTVVGYTVTFTGKIVSSAYAVIPATVLATAPTDADGNRVDTDVTTTNTAGAQVFAPDGQQSDVTPASDDFTRKPLRITTNADKSIVRDSVWSVAGASTLVSIAGSLVSTGSAASTVGAESLVISDPVSPGTAPSTFWNNFDLNGVVSTEIPTGSQMTFQAWNGTAWVPLAENVPAQAGWTFTPTAAQRASIQGVRFIFTPATAGQLLQPGFNVLPYFTVSLRDQLRDGSGPAAGPAATINNDASASATNKDAVNPTVTDTSSDSVDLKPINPGPGTNFVNKKWDQDTVPALSDQTRTAHLTWGTQNVPLSSMTISDPATSPALADVKTSVFDAWDLSSLSPVTPSSDPLMTFDAVGSVQLFNSATGAWQDITSTVCPSASSCDGTFPGYTLTAAQRASTTGVKVTFIESPTRASRISRPTDPQVGSGVAGSGVTRPLDLVFQVRQLLRSDPLPPSPTDPLRPWLDGTAITGKTTMNEGSPGVVRNTVGAVASAPSGTQYTDSDYDDITVVDSPLNISASKTFAQTEEGLPPAGTDQAKYPLSTATLTAKNASASSKASLLTIADPLATQADPTFFDTHNLYQLRTITLPAGANSAAAVVTLTRGGVTTTYTVAQAMALQPSDLVDVTGFRLDMPGSFSPGAQATIVADYQLRPERRSNGQAPIAGSDAVNQISATAEAPGPKPGGTVATTTASDGLPLVTPTYGVTTSKSITPGSVYEDQSKNYTVTLKGQPTGTARTAILTLTDATPTFWNAFTLTSLSRVTLAKPVAQIKVDALVGVTMTMDGDNLVYQCNGSTDLTACWTAGTWQSVNGAGAVTPALPSGVAAADVRGLRFSYQAAGGAQWERPSNPPVSAALNLTRRDSLVYGQDGATDQPVPSTQPGLETAPGEPKQGVMTNAVQAHGEASWLNESTGDLWIGDAADTETTTLRHRVTALSVTKKPTGAFAPGSPIPFVMTVKNTGARTINDLTLTDAVVADSSGSMLVEPDVDPENPTSPYSFTWTDKNGAAKTIPSPGFSATLDPDSGTLAITTPAGFAFAVGDTLSISATLQFRTGLAPGTAVGNTITATADRPLDTCTRTHNGTVVTPDQTSTINQDPNTIVTSCTADTVVEPLPAAPLRVIKSVKGVGAGVPDAKPGDQNYDDLGTLATGTTSPALCQTPNGTAGYWRSPCVPITRPGGTEAWRVDFTNYGNVNAVVVAGIDVLPAPGDSGVIIPLPRSSNWKAVLSSYPTFTGAVAGGTPVVYALTTTPSVACNAADILSETQPGGLDPSDPCASDVAGRNWKVLSADASDAELASVVAFKFVMTYPGAAGDGSAGLAPGKTVTLNYNTQTAWQASVAESSDRQPIAWNSVAIGARGTLNSINYVTGVVEPRKTGVAMATGKLDLAKSVVTPPNWSIVLPSSYDFTLSCTSGPEKVDIVDTTGSDQSAVTLPADGSVVHINEDAGPATPWSDLNIPLYANCFVKEKTPPPGVTTTYSDQPVVAVRDFTANAQVVHGAWDEPVQVPTITTTNTYSNASFSVTKKVDNGGAVDQDGNPIAYNETYSFTATCTYLGQEVVADADQAFTLTGGATKTFTGLPAGSSCSVKESGPAGAASTTMRVDVSGDTGTPTKGTEADFTLVGDKGDASDPQVAVLATNTYQVGSLQITKKIDGDGADAWGSTSFTAHAVCALSIADPATVYSASHTLSRASDLTWTIDNLPAGASCAVTETDTGAANATEIATSPVTITAGDTPAAVTITNTFTTGSIVVTKQLAGGTASTMPGATEATYTVALACTREVNGAESPVAIPGGASRTITGAGTATYDGLPTGATCEVSETNIGNATSSEVSPQSVTVGDSAASVGVTVTNTFPDGWIELTKTISGDGAQFAPTSFPATVACTWPGASGDAVDLGDNANVTLSPDAPVTIDGIPVGSACSVTEADSGQSAATVTPSQIAVTSTTAAATAVVDNRYDLASLKVTKQVVPADGKIPTGFGFTATCTFQGQTVLPETSFTLDNGGEKVFTGLPARAACTVVETDPRGATSTQTAVTVDDPESAPTADQDTRTATIPSLTADAADAAGTPRNTVGYTNLYDVGGLVVTKAIAGGAGAQIGTPQTYEASVVCTFEGETVFSDTVELTPENAHTWSTTEIPTGASCTVTEVDPKGADVVVITPNDGEDTTKAVVPITSDGVNEATITNWFLSGSLALTKVVSGPGAEKFGTGTFDLSMQCTLGGKDLTLDGGPTRTVSAASPKALYEHLPTGAKCRVSETNAGGATSSTISDADGKPVTVDADGGYTFTVTTDATQLSDDDQPQPALTVTNTFALGSVSATKKLSKGSPVPTGDFTFALVCTFNGKTITGDSPSAQKIAVGGTVTWPGLPHGAQCVFTETDTRGAKATTIRVGDVTTTGTSASVAVGSKTVTLHVVNTFDKPTPPVKPPTPPVKPPTPPVKPPTPPVHPPLPNTGGQIALWAVPVGAVLILAGLGLFVIRRRRTAAEDAAEVKDEGTES